MAIVVRPEAAGHLAEAGLGRSVAVVTDGSPGAAATAKGAITKEQIAEASLEAAELFINPPAS
jgi:hypothetical protein